MPPARSLELIISEADPAGQDDREGQKESEGRSGLDPARVIAALAVRRVLRDVRRRAAVLHRRAPGPAPAAR